MRTEIDKLGKVAVTVEKDYWKRTKVYNKLTIVERQGIFGTYISRKAVPAGIDITNREYWIPFSSLRENLITDYNKFIDRFNYLINEHDSAIDDIQLLVNSIVEHLPNGIIVEADTKFIKHGTTADVILEGKLVDEGDSGYWFIRGEGFGDIEAVDPKINFNTSGGHNANSIKVRIKNCTPNSTLNVICNSISKEYKYIVNWVIGDIYPSYLGFIADGVIPNPTAENMYELGKIENDVTGRYIRTCKSYGSKLCLYTPKDVIVESIRMNGFDIRMEVVGDVIWNDITYTFRRSVSTYTNGGDEMDYPIMINAYKEDRGDIISDLLNNFANLPTPDEEDITYDSSKNRYKFADKDYNADEYTGYGRKYLRNNRSYNALPFDGFVNNVSVRAGVYSGEPAGIYFDVSKGRFVAKANPAGSSNNDNTEAGFILVPDIQITPIEIYYTDWTRGRNLYNPISPVTVYKHKGTDNYYRYDGLTLVKYYGPIEATVNTLIQSMINEPNTRYIIQYDYDLLGQTINLPENAILDFEGGSIKNGTLVGTTCGVQGTPRFENVSLQGSWNERVYAPNRPDNPYIGQFLLIDIGNKRINETKFIPCWWTGDAWIDANGNEV